MAAAAVMVLGFQHCCRRDGKPEREKINVVSRQINTGRLLQAPKCDSGSRGLRSAVSVTSIGSL